MTKLLMPKATAVWLVDNSGLTFDQVAEFTGLHSLEIQAIADGEVVGGMQGLDPVQRKQLSSAEIARCEADPTARLILQKSDLELPTRRKRGPRYTPVSKRADKPDAIFWLVKHHPELIDSQIGRLIGTTKPTIVAIREKTHWNSANLKARSPVEIGLCAQADLSFEIQKAIKAGRKPLAQPIIEQRIIPATETSTWEGLK